MRRILLLTPTLTGHDGLSCLSRQLRDALQARTRGEVEAMHLEQGPARFIAAVCRAATRPDAPDIAVVAHAHLLPAVWPLLWRGTRILPILVGIEAWQPLTPARARVLRRAGRAIAISHHTEREFKRANPDFDDLRVDVCWPAAPALHEPPPVTDTESPFALIVGRMAADERYKGHDQLVDIWPRVQAAVPAARLVIAGTGDDLERLRQRVEQAKLSPAIVFAHGVSSHRLAELYRDCAFMVLPSRREGFGYVLLEAMRAGKACIGGKGAAEEIIVPGETGLVVDPDSPSELLDAVVALFTDDERRARMGDAGRTRADSVFSTERFQADLERAIAEC